MIRGQKVTRGKLLISAAVAAMVCAGTLYYTQFRGNTGDGTAKRDSEIGAADRTNQASDIATRLASEKQNSQVAESETSPAAFSHGPPGYRSLLNRLIAGGLMADYGPEFTRLLGGELLAISDPCDLETFLGRLDACTSPEEVKNVLAPLADALREAEKTNDPNLLDIRRQLGVALLFAAEQVAENSGMSMEEQLDTLVRIGGTLVGARQPQLALALNDVALDFTAVPDSKQNRRNVDAILRGRLEVAARVQDIGLFDSATERWVQTSRDQADSSVGARWRLYAQRLATFPTSQINSLGGGSWPGLNEASTAAILSIGTGWLKPPAGADKTAYVATRDGFVSQLDDVIRSRTVSGGNVEEMKKLTAFRNKVATTRIC